MMSQDVRRIKWQQKWLPRYFYQHIYIPMLYCVVSSTSTVLSRVSTHAWALKQLMILTHNVLWVLSQDIISIHLYGSCHLYPLKFGTWALTREWVLARPGRYDSTSDTLNVVHIN